MSAIFRFQCGLILKFDNPKLGTLRASPRPRIQNFAVAARTMAAPEVYGKLPLLNSKQHH
jgi:hypothetical protein